MRGPPITRQSLGLVAGMVAAIALTAAALISLSTGPQAPGTTSSDQSVND